jgi:hypothetical protein
MRQATAEPWEIEFSICYVGTGLGHYIVQFCDKNEGSKLGKLQTINDKQTDFA